MTRKMFRRGLLLAAAIFLFEWGIADKAIAQQYAHTCPGGNEFYDQHMLLLSYSILAQAAYEEIGVWYPELPRQDCPVEIESHVDLSAIEIKQIPHSVLDLSKDAIERRADLCNLPRPDVHFYEERTATLEKYVSCTREKQPLRLAMSVRFVANNDTMALLPRVILILGDQILSGLTDKEKLRIIELQRVGDSEKIFGIQGTQLSENLLSQLKTSIEQLTGASCLFGFSQEVANHFFVNSIIEEYRSNRNNVSFSIVGHSLGGAVAQHIGSHEDFQTIIRRFYPDAVFRAYSFNSIGLSDVQHGHQHLRRIHSVQISGELLEYWNTRFGLGTEQVGNVLRYGEDLDSTASIAERGTRHEIERVQMEICRCLRGMGAFTYKSSPSNL